MNMDMNTMTTTMIMLVIGLYYCDVRYEKRKWRSEGSVGAPVGTCSRGVIFGTTFLCQDF